MTGSTHLDVELESGVESTTLGQETSTTKVNEEISASKSPNFVGPPRIIKAELVSRSRLVATFNVPIKGPKSCNVGINKESQRRMQSQKPDKDLGCCQQVFREPPFLNSYGKLL